MHGAQMMYRGEEMIHHTATEIADALKIKRNSVLSCLDDVAADSVRIIAGQRSARVGVSSLPARLQMRLAKAAEIGGHRNIVKRLLQNRAPNGAAASSFGNPSGDIDGARKLQQALAPAAGARKNDCSLCSRVAGRRHGGIQAGLSASQCRPVIGSVLFDRTIRRNGAFLTNGNASNFTFLIVRAKSAPFFSAAVLMRASDSDCRSWAVIAQVEKQENLPTSRKRILFGKKPANGLTGVPAEPTTNAD